MYWEHECSETWLKARKNYLTASEIAKVVSVTDTGRKRSQAQVVSNMRTLWAEKRSANLETRSTGAAARGHILEPYAVNEIDNVYHWDDAIIVSHKYPGLGYSPDGLSIPQMNVGTWPVYHMSSLPHIECIVEVKSYSPDRHMHLATTNIKELPERWQLAVAMMITEADWGHLVGFNPEMPDDMQVIEKSFFFDDFNDEMNEIDKALALWTELTEAWDKGDGIISYHHKAKVSYADIIKNYNDDMALAHSSLNPRG